MLCSFSLRSRFLQLAENMHLPQPRHRQRQDEAATAPHPDPGQDANSFLLPQRLDGATLRNDGGFAIQTREELSSSNNKHCRTTGRKFKASERKHILTLLGCGTPSQDAVAAKSSQSRGREEQSPALPRALLVLLSPKPRSPPRAANKTQVPRRKSPSSTTTPRSLEPAPAGWGRRVPARCSPTPPRGCCSSCSSPGERIRSRHRGGKRQIWGSNGRREGIGSSTAALAALQAHPRGGF